ncbi:MAG: hypothetical protein R6U63_01900 [Longimicrobiales bacterium]
MNGIGPSGMGRDRAAAGERRRAGRTGSPVARRATALAAALFAAGTLAGCAPVFGGYDLAPNGLPRAEADLRRELARQPGATYEQVVEGERELPDDDLLRLLYAGTVGRYSEHSREAAQFLDVAGYVADDRVTLSVSRQALSFITSDRALVYTPSRTERLMIPYTSAVAFLEAGAIGDAVVEARRIEALLDRFDDDVPRAEIPASSRFLHAFAATIFDAAGEDNAAAVAWRRAGFRAGSTPDPAVPEAFAALPEDSLGEVVVLVERGFVPHRVEQSVVIAIPPFHLEALTRGGPGEKAVAATAAAGQVLLTAAAYYGHRGPYYTDHGYRRTMHLRPWSDACGGWNAPDWCDDDPDPYFLRVSWPVLYHDPVPDGPVRVRAGTASVSADRRLDVSAGVRADFNDARAAIVARTIFRAAAKVVLSESAEHAVGERDETAGRIVGLLVNLGTLLTERADTRSWHLLPGSVSMARLRLPPGTHPLAVEGAGILGRDVDLEPVEVRAGRTTFVARRIWR